MMNNEWKLIKNSHAKTDFIDESIADNLIIRKGINFLIGKNNSGKSKIMEGINNKLIGVCEQGLNLNIETHFFKTTSLSIEDENSVRSAISSASMSNFVDKFNESKNNVTDRIFNEIINVDPEFKEFMDNKEVWVTQKTKSVITSTIDGVDSNESGSGENRITYMLYSVVNLLKEVDKAYAEIINNTDLMRKYIEEFNLTDEEKDSMDMLFKLVSEKTHESSNYIYKTNIVGEYGLDKKIWLGIEAFLKYVRFVKEKKGDAAARLTLLPFNKTIDMSWGIVDEFRTKEEIIERYGNFEFELAKEFYGLISELGDDNYKFTRQKKESVINDYWKEYLGQDTRISLRFLVMIDEPELFIHSSKFKLIGKIFNYILNIDDYDIRILTSTHDERIIKGSKEYIENVNVVYKKERRVFVKNIFNNNIEDFINELRVDYNKFFKEANKDDLVEVEKDKLFIEEQVDFLSKEYIEWFITYKNNLKIFFTDNIFIVEGHHDKMMIEELIKDTQQRHSEVIEADGTYLGMLIWIRLLIINRDHFMRIKFLLDLDVKPNARLKAQTQLMRLYIYRMFSDDHNIELFSSLYNDITTWAVKDKMKLDWVIKNKESLELKSKELHNDKISRDEFMKWIINESKNLSDELMTLKSSKEILIGDYSKFKFAKDFNYSERGYWAIGETKNNYLFNKMMIFESFKSLEDNFKLNSPTGTNSYVFEKEGDIFVEEFYINDVETFPTIKNNFEISKRIIVSKNLFLKFESEYRANNIVIDIDKKKIHYISAKDEPIEKNGVLSIELESVETKDVIGIYKNKVIDGCYKVTLSEGHIIINMNSEKLDISAEVNMKLADEIVKKTSFKIVGLDTMFSQFEEAKNWPIPDKKVILVVDFTYPMKLLKNVSPIMIGPFNADKFNYDDIKSKLNKFFDSWELVE